MIWLTTPENLIGLVKSARKRNNLLYDDESILTQRVRLLADEDQTFDPLQDSVRNTVPLVRTVKDKKAKGKKNWMKTLMEERNKLLRTTCQLLFVE